jgi:hypothetical protein
METEMERLKRDRNLLMIEIIKLRQQQQSARKEMMEMEQRLHVHTQLKFGEIYGLIRLMHLQFIVCQCIKLAGIYDVVPFVQAF